VALAGSGPGWSRSAGTAATLECLGRKESVGPSVWSARRPRASLRVACSSCAVRCTLSSCGERLLARQQLVAPWFPQHGFTAFSGAVHPQTPAVTEKGFTRRKPLGFNPSGEALLGLSQKSLPLADSACLYEIAAVGTVHLANCMLFRRFHSTSFPWGKAAPSLGRGAVCRSGLFPRASLARGGRNASWGRAGPSGTNVVREDVRRLSIHRA